MTDIPGAISSTYKVTSADLGEQISVRVTATNSAGSATAGSTLTAAVVNPAVAGWSRVPLGPGGFISGLSFHSDGTKIVRMDTSGAYKWNATTSRWDMMVTKSSMDGFVGSIPDADSEPGAGTNPGAYEVAIAPSNSNRFYMMWSHDWDGRVWVSDNKGASWVKRTSRATDTIEGNSQEWRGAGKKLAVDPINADHVICGGTIGVTLSIDAGVTWTTISTAQIPAATAEGLYLFAFDPSSATASGRKQGIYCFSHGNGLYKTTNGGTTWTLAASGGPTMAYILAVSSAGKVFTGTSKVANLCTLYTLPSGGAWSSVSAEPLGNTSNGNMVWGLCFDPADNSRMVAVSEVGGLSYSTNSGVTWTGFGPLHTDFDPIEWLNTLNGGDGNYPLYGGSLTWDATDGTVHQGHGLGTCKTTPTWVKGTTNWIDNSIGLEQLCAKRILKPPGNSKVILAAMDMGMFGCDGTNYPATKGTTDAFCAAWSADYCPTDPTTIICLLNQSPAPLPFEVSGVSRNGGTTWTQFSNKTYNSAPQRSGGMIACGSHKDNFVLTLGDNGTLNPLQYTVDGGANWAVCNLTAIAGIPNPQSGDVGFLANYYYARQTICSDKVLADTFYARNNNAGFIRSTDKGATWHLRFSSPGNTYANARLAAVPGNAGHLFYAQGLYFPLNTGDALIRSTDGGATWTQAHAQVKEVHAIGFGKALAGGYPAIYIAGYHGGSSGSTTGYGIWRSDDNSVTWVKIGDFPMGCFDSAQDITGDPDVYGVCYLSTGASGIFRYTP